MDKKALTPTEFAALFSRERSWTYRQIKAGKIATISSYGRIMIPASEADRIAADINVSSVGSRQATGEGGDSKKRRPKIGSAAWSAWIERQTSRSSKRKGME
jgi:hypothetical protein